jgi:phosphotransacetylase
MTSVQGKTFDEIKVGDKAQTHRTLQARDMRAWASAFGDMASKGAAPDTQDAAGIVTALLTGLVRSALPGPGANVQSVSIDIVSTLPIDTLLTVSLTVREKRAGSGLVVLDAHCSAPGARIVATGVCEVKPSAEPIRREVFEHSLDSLLDRCLGLPPMATAVVHPCSTEALLGAAEAAEAGLIVPVLYGPPEQLHRLADAAKLDISAFKIVATEEAEDSAIKAAMAAGAGEVQALMKGSLHTDVLLHAAMQKEAKLRTGRLLSHCALLSVPTYGRRFILTDAALNIAPDTDQKRDIAQNAIDFAHAMGFEVPKLAVLAAVETVNTKMPATLDGAILAKMSDRGQISVGIVDGPLDLDAAVDVEAAKTKLIKSPVAGVADILLAPNIEAANMIYKNLAFMADAQTAGLVVGARVPIILTSRADTAAARRFSCAIAVLYAESLKSDAKAAVASKASTS